MQSEPNESSQNKPLTQSTQDSNQDSQHGFDQPDLQPSPRPCPGGAGGGTPRWAASNAGSSSSAGGSDDGLERSLQRLSPPSRPRTGSPVDRIAEHEKRLPHLPRRKNQGPSFTVVQGGKKPGLNQTAIVEFPNGSLLVASISILLILCRGLDPYFVASSSCFFIRRFPSLKAFPSAGHDTSRVENRVLALLSWG